MTTIEVVYLVAIAIVWSRGSIFRRVRTCGLSGDVLAKASLPVRAWVALADCPLCSGWWIGALGHALYLRAPAVVAMLGQASLVGVATLTVCAAIRKL